MKKNTSVFVCSECGYESAKWNGICPSCGQGNTMEEEFRETTLKMREKYFDPHAHLNLRKTFNSNSKNENLEIEKKLNKQTDTFFNKMLPLIQTRKWLQQKYSKPIPTQFYLGNTVKR